MTKLKRSGASRSGAGSSLPWLGGRHPGEHEAKARAEPAGEEAVGGRTVPNADLGPCRALADELDSRAGRASRPPSGSLRPARATAASSEPAPGSRPLGEGKVASSLVPIRRASRGRRVIGCGREPAVVEARVHPDHHGVDRAPGRPRRERRWSLPRARSAPRHARSAEHERRARRGRPSRAAAWAELRRSSGRRSAIPRRRSFSRWSATRRAGVVGEEGDAIPSSRSAATARSAPGIGWSASQTTPSTSQRSPGHVRTLGGAPRQ